MVTAIVMQEHARRLTVTTARFINVIARRLAVVTAIGEGLPLREMLLQICWSKAWRVKHPAPSSLFLVLLRRSPPPARTSRRAQLLR